MSVQYGRTPWYLSQHDKVSCQPPLERATSDTHPKICIIALANLGVRSPGCHPRWRLWSRCGAHHVSALGQMNLRKEVALNESGTEPLKESRPVRLRIDRVGIGYSHERTLPPPPAPLRTAVDVVERAPRRPCTIRQLRCMRLPSVVVSDPPAVEANLQFLVAWLNGTLPSGSSIIPQGDLIHWIGKGILVTFFFAPCTVAIYLPVGSAQW